MLDFSFWSIFWAVFNVIVLFILLRIFLFKPINKIRDERTRTIQNDLDSARKAKDEAEELRQQYEESISEAKEEANRIIMKAHDDAETERAADTVRKGDQANQGIRIQRIQSRTDPRIQREDKQKENRGPSGADSRGPREDLQERTYPD